MDRDEILLELRDRMIEDFEMMREGFFYGKEDSPLNTYLNEIINGYEHEINWSELANHFLDDIEQETGKKFGEEDE